jgi:hypothetical protein
MTRLAYPLLTPPIDLSRRASWTKRETRTYFDWFLTELAVGAARVREFLGVDRHSDAEQQLQEAGERLAGLLPDPAFSEPSRQEQATLRGHQIAFESGPLLTEMGASLAIDVGCLMAELLQREMPWLQWEIIRRPPSDVSFNLPVLSGFKAGRFDPMLIGMNLGHRVLAGKGRPTEWRDTYRWWRADSALRLDD